MKLQKKEEVIPMACEIEHYHKEQAQLNTRRLL